jgi:hypothetical protein
MAQAQRDAPECALVLQTQVAPAVIGKVRQSHICRASAAGQQALSLQCQGPLATHCPLRNALVYWQRTRALAPPLGPHTYKFRPPRSATHSLAASPGPASTHTCSPTTSCLTEGCWRRCLMRPTSGGRAASHPVPLWPLWRVRLLLCCLHAHLGRLRADQSAKRRCCAVDTVRERGSTEHCDGAFCSCCVFVATQVPCSFLLRYSFASA